MKIKLNVRKGGNWIGHVLHVKCLLKHITEGMTKGMEDEEEDLSSYWMNLRKRVDTGI
jgi:hypothetical protein